MAGMVEVSVDTELGGYAEFASELPDVFRCSWQRSGPGGASATVLPDACADVVVDQSGAAVLVGPTMTPHRQELDPALTLRGLRLQPWAIPLLFRSTARQVRDEVLPLDALLGDRAARAVAEAVWHQRLPQAWTRVDTSPWQMGLVRGLLRASSGAIERTGRDRGMSERQARRMMRELTGLSPRELAHVGRLHRLLDLIDRSDHSLATVATDSGYSDQAHMTRDLKQLTGVTPRSLRHERRDLDGWTSDRQVTTVADLITA